MLVWFYWPEKKLLIKFCICSSIILTKLLRKIKDNCYLNIIFFLYNIYYFLFYGV
jgi:hypothetical protein